MGKERENAPAPITLEEVTRQAAEVLLQNGSYMPTVIAEGDTGSVIIGIRDMADTHEGRRAQMGMTGFALAYQSVVGSSLRQVFFITEAWMSTPEQGKPPEVPPSKDPKRKEVLIVSQYEVGPSKSTVAILEMRRDHEGQLREVRPLEQATDGDIRVESPLLLAFVTGFRIGSGQL